MNEIEIATQKFAADHIFLTLKSKMTTSNSKVTDFMKLNMDVFEKNVDGIEFGLCFEQLKDETSEGDITDWSKKVYETLRDFPFNERVNHLNRSRKVCLGVVYDLMNAYYLTRNKVVFAKEIKNRFGEIIKEILQICVPMDRAQSLYKMQVRESNKTGMHWYGEVHAKDPEFLKILGDYKGSHTINKRLFTAIEIIENDELASLLVPELAQIVKHPPVNS